MTADPLPTQNMLATSKSAQDQKFDASTENAKPHDKPTLVLAQQDATSEATQAYISNSTPSSDYRSQKFGSYHIEGLIAEGGMGAVYRARHLTLGRMVALKVIRSHGMLSSEVSERFQAEAIAVAGLEHPGIVPLFESGVVDGKPFIAMALVDGESLAQRIKNQPMHPSLAARIIEVVARAVSYAHQRGIIHRDIKPQNILMTSNGDPVLTDFGLAKQIENKDDSLTVDGQVLGTPGFMPPEQATGRKDAIGPASDIYSLGATLYCLLTGRPPFLAASITETLYQVTFADPVPPRKLNNRIPKDLETICLKCLRKNPLERYKTATELFLDLERFRLHRPIRARPASLFEVCGKWARRNPVLATLLGLMLMAATAAPIYYFSIPAYLKLHVEPSDAIIIVNGREIKTIQGDASIQLKPDRYQVHISRSGYQPASKDVLLVRGKANTVFESVVLETESGYLRLESDPSAASVIVHDAKGQLVDSGVSPYNSSLLPTGNYAVTISKALYKSQAITADVPFGGRVTKLAKVKLEPEFEHSESYDNFLKRLAIMEQTIKKPWVFNSLPLLAALQRIQDTEEIQVRVENTRQWNDLGVSPETPIGLNIKGINLSNALKLLLVSLELEAYPKLEEGQLTITVVPRNTVLEIVIFPVGDLIPENEGKVGNAPKFGMANFSRLLNDICSTVSPDSWQQSGGVGTISIDPISKSIVVKQSWESLVELEYYLRSRKQSIIAEQSRETKK